MPQGWRCAAIRDRATSSRIIAWPATIDLFVTPHEFGPGTNVCLTVLRCKRDSRS